MSGRLRRARTWRAELCELDDGLTPTKLAKPGDTTPDRFFWCLPVPGKSGAFMYLNAGRADHNGFLVPVNAKMSNQLWPASGLNSPERPDDCPLCKNMTSDNKYRHTVNGSATGWDSPVPLTNIALKRGRTPSIRFSNGVTRILWLLTNNVATFSVLVIGEDNVRTLAKLAGTNGSIMCVPEVMRGSKRTPQSGQESLDTGKGGMRQKRAENTSEKVSRGQGRSPHGRGIRMDD